MSLLQIKSSDDWAREFKLHSCIGNKKFQKQIQRIQAEVLRAVVELQDGSNADYSNLYMDIADKLESGK